MTTSFLLAAEHPELQDTLCTFPIDAPTLQLAQQIAQDLITSYILLGSVLPDPRGHGGDYLFTYRVGSTLVLATVEALSLADASCILDAFATDGVIVQSTEA